MSFLSVFKSILHVTETAAKLAAPFVAAVDPVIGTLMIQATNAAVGVESIITTPGSGTQKAGIVNAGTQATIDAINGVLASQGLKPLPANTADTVAQTVKSVIDALNTKASAFPQTWSKLGNRIVVSGTSSAATAKASGFLRVTPDPLVTV